MAKSATTESSEAPPVDLNRPIGFPSPPTSVPLPPSFRQRTRDLLSTPNQHKQILEEEGGSYWADFHAMRVNNGKQWIAPKHLFKAEKSLYFPNLRGRTLTSDDAELLPLFNKPSLIRVYSATSGEEHIHKLGDESGLQIIDINIQTNAIKYALLKLFLGRIKALIEPHRHDRYFILGSGWERRLKIIGATNAYVGYAYLLDKEGKIRWASCGRLTEDERETLHKLSTKLIQSRQ